MLLSGVPEKYRAIVEQAASAYTRALLAGGQSADTATRQFGTFLGLVGEQLASPFQFEPYHRKITAPFDYYTFGVDFFRPIINKPASTLTGRDHLVRLAGQLVAGDNVIFLANHQSEADPQAISVMLEDEFDAIGRNMIFVAGERVITDPLTAPFSKGRNLLCIFSKRHIDHPPEQKAAKTNHNRKTMEGMAELLSEGGHCIYVAPSGGRDRRDAAGTIAPALFDPQNVEMFYLMAQRAERPTHFYPMALQTWDILPPPDQVQVELGEPRTMTFTPIHVAIGGELDLARFDALERAERRVARADAAWTAVRDLYAGLHPG